ncbi:hypothetical protein PAPYR_1656 [Paratrimastix pyriformis]|uniref:RING-type domain-containing protein n=1 Tax=Paratrimastix pyriformis TaxID=342808 RepID=A0ABQ8UYX0_9EUKA|nr:hypothetical protein PAPYR_1656 [Paratrimastix pyriformis]
MELQREQEGFPRGLFVQEIPDVMVCPICHGVMRQAVTLLCRGNHKACEVCCERWMKNQPATCPCCRQELAEPHYNRDTSFDSLIQLLPVRCPQHPCEWQGKLADLTRHQTQECSQGEATVCPDCHQPIPRSALDAHRAQCPSALQACPVPGCDAQVARCRLEDHLATTSDLPHMARLQHTTKAALDACRADLERTRAESAAALQRVQGEMDALREQSSFPTATRRPADGERTIPSRDALTRQIQALLARGKGTEPATGCISLRILRWRLEEHFGMDLGPVKETIKEIVCSLAPQ